MASTITAGNASNGGLTYTADTTGALEIKTGTGTGTTAISINSSQTVTIAQNQVVTGNLTVNGSLSTAGGGTLTAASIKSAAANTPTEFQDSTGAQIGTLCRAWVNFNGTGTPAIRASFNVTTIGDNGTGDYTVNFAIAMPDINYSVVCGNGSDVTGSAALQTANPSQAALNTTLAVRVVSGFMGSGATNRTSTDPAFYNVAVFR